MRASCSSSRERAPTTQKIARVSETGLEGTVFQRLSIDAGCRCSLFGCSAIVERANLFSREPVIPQYERSRIQVVLFEFWLHLADQSATSDRFPRCPAHGAIWNLDVGTARTLH